MTKFLYLLLPFLLFTGIKTDLPDSKLAKQVREKVWPGLQKELVDKGFKASPDIYIRIFKAENDMEIWVKSGARYEFFKPYNICYFSGGLGPKTREGDDKSPEGFYTIEPNQLYPVSNYHLAINIGYPNKLEVLKRYTGNAIMIHGNCASIGCYAITDSGIDDIYTLVYKALAGGQKKINVAIFPFRMDAKRMQTYATNPNMPYWKTLQPGYSIFEKTQIPPVAEIKGENYYFRNQ